MHVLCNQFCTSPGQTNLQDKTDGLLEEVANLKNTSMEGMILFFRKYLCSFVSVSFRKMDKGRAK